MKLPPLPDTPWLGYDPERGDLFGFDVEALRAYGKACALAVLEEAAKVCVSQHANGNHKYDTREECADAIRALRAELENTK